MNNHEINKTFLALTDAETKHSVLTAIAEHYGISRADAENEVTTQGSEHLLDYLTGPVRRATHILMQRHGLLAADDSLPNICGPLARGPRI